MNVIAKSVISKIFSISIHILPCHQLFRPTLAALIMQALAIYFTYGLQCYMPIRILNYGYAIPAIEDGTCKGTPFLWDLIIRFGITIITCKR